MPSKNTTADETSHDRVSVDTAARAGARAQRATASFALSHWLLCRFVGAINLVAFVSLHVQVRGLFGSDGVLPLASRMEHLRERLDGVLWLRAPSTLWMTGAGDGALELTCFAGEVASVALMLGALSGPAALLCFALYLSFVSLGAPFLPLQWDTLLLEATLLVCIASPWRQLLSTPRNAATPAPLTRASIVVLLVRLVLASGLVKLLSGDLAWRDLSAMSFHYETQPLPGPLAPFAHHLPAAWHEFETAGVLTLELVLPLLLLAPDRRGRHVAAAGIASLMALIFATGNYGFFNLLTAALCLSCVDDAALTSRMPVVIRRWIAQRPNPSAARPAQRAIPSALATFMMVLGLTQFAWTCGLRPQGRYREFVEAVATLRLASSYGLFAVMTRERPELVIEGSRDGRTWLAYELRYKPGDVTRGPLQVAPHMPRLDWMLWFAALGDPEGAAWVLGLERALLDGSPAALSLFARDPFDGLPPRYVRITRWRYHFGQPGQEAAWTRDGAEPFGPALVSPLTAP